MDEQRFDGLTLHVTRVASRRQTIVALAAFVAGGASAPPSIGASRRRRRRRRCNPPCPTCQVCNTRRGRCQPGGNSSACGVCRSCQGGVCGPVADGVACGECLVCGGGACATTAPDGTACRTSGQCGSGRCFPRPTCAPASSPSCNPFDGSPCCSGTCSIAFPAVFCSASLAGDPCLTTSDCDTGLTCRVFLCG